LKFKFNLLTLIVVLVIVFGNVVPARGDFRLPHGVLFHHIGYNYAPSVIQEENTQKFWWCGQGTVPGTSFTTDVIYNNSYNFKTGEWSEPAMVLWPSLGKWDSQYTCDPSVIQGTFSNPKENGKNYSYAMYYGGTDDISGNCRVGLAYSNDGVTWVKYGKPVIYPQSYPTSSYGAGQPATYNSDRKAGIVLFHTDTSTSLGQRVWVRKTTDGINFSSPILLSNQGAFLFADSDFALDPVSGYVYAATPVFGRPGDRDIYSFVLCKMPAEQLLHGQGVWETLGYVDTTLTGFYLNHSPGLLRDKYGYIAPLLPKVIVYFSGGSNDPSTWDLTWARWAPTPINKGNEAQVGCVVRTGEFEGAQDAYGKDLLC